MNFKTVWCSLIKTDQADLRLVSQGKGTNVATKSNRTHLYQELAYVLAPGHPVAESLLHILDAQLQYHCRQISARTP